MAEGASTPTATMLTAAEVAPMLGISARKVYELAGDPLPCYRVGGAVRFRPEDVTEYLNKCRSTATKRKTAGVLSLTVSSPGSDASALENAFRKLGVVRGRTNTTGKKRTASTTERREGNLRLV